MATGAAKGAAATGAIAGAMAGAAGAGSAGKAEPSARLGISPEVEAGENRAMGDAEGDGTC